MTRSYANLTAIFITTLILSGCATTDNSIIKTEKHASVTSSQTTSSAVIHDPTSIQILTKPVAGKHYSKLGHIHVPHYNSVGIRRQQAVINDLLVDHAAKMGGNAVIVKRTNLADVGEIIRLPS